MQERRAADQTASLGLSRAGIQPREGQGGKEGVPWTPGESGVGTEAHREAEKKSFKAEEGGSQRRLCPELGLTV